jgi:hypothetical protein
MPILVMFAVLAAFLVEAAPGVITTLIAIEFITLVVDAVVFLVTLDRDT